ncbi:hypothetical protein [Chengkuizengella sediminis]|uniref:hypothetical protein n=1 Tax=Chengkuizengella sediminis TaxID=1885917 RepID=UPI001389EAAF|nr:hypothetical protein [Chengkuizengella sediminis]NDI37178.1 hypothetical protein [Chengkuizengella sediminis]
MATIKAILDSGAASAMTIEEIMLQEIYDWNLSSEKNGCILDTTTRNESDIKDRKKMTVGESGRLEEATNLANNKLIHGFIRKLVDQNARTLEDIKALQKEFENQKSQRNQYKTRSNGTSGKPKLSVIQPSEGGRAETKDELKLTRQIDGEDARELVSGRG